MSSVVRAFVALALLTALAACSRADAVRAARVALSKDPAAAAEAVARSKAVGYAANPMALAGDVERFRDALDELRRILEDIWGEDEAQTPTPKQYVKYTHNYLSRATVDFDTGVIEVTTLEQENPLERLENAIVTTLLAPSDPRAVDLYSDSEIKLGATPFLLGEVKDADGKDIRWGWRAQRYARHLIDTALVARDIDGRTARSVVFKMEKDHLDIRARKYRALVEAAAARFDVSRNLIYAVMKVESDFNPFALSHAMAVGLMQVVPTTAGGDVYRYLNGRKGQPSADDLFHPPTNVTYGTAYLHLLQTRLLRGIHDPVSREYCVIAGYNGGPGTVLRTFHADADRARARINAMPPAEVYATLRKELPYAETRRYLDKTLTAKKRFVNF